MEVTKTQKTNKLDKLPKDLSSKLKDLFVIAKLIGYDLVLSEDLTTLDNKRNVIHLDFNSYDEDIRMSFQLLGEEIVKKLPRELNVLKATTNITLIKYDKQSIITVIDVLARII